jgi:hypothetical protein
MLDYKQLGDKYYIPVDLLKKNKVVFRKMVEGAIKPVKTMNMVIVSNPIRNILLDYVLNKKWSIKDYQKLSNEDKNLLNKILYDVGLDYELGVEHDHDGFHSQLRRFEELKAELMVDDNFDRKKFREMKLIVLKLIAGNKLSRGQGFSILYDLANLVEF